MRRKKILAGPLKVYFDEDRQKCCPTKGRQDMNGPNMRSVPPQIVAGKKDIIEGTWNLNSCFMNGAAFMPFMLSTPSSFAIHAIHMKSHHTTNSLKLLDRIWGYNIKRNNYNIKWLNKEFWLICITWKSYTDNIKYWNSNMSSKKY